MGDWHISIQGVGCHHNKDNPTDANRLAADFVAQLKRFHHVTEATFTHGGKEDLSPQPER